MYKCPVCNSYMKSQSKDKNLYCRKCIELKGEKVSFDYKVKAGGYCLKYNLTKEQKKASDFILNCVKNNQNCTLNAVCGAGKTEIIYDTIKYSLNNGKKIGIAIPRRDVVIELKERISKDFDVKVIAVYGGETKCLNADIVIFTTHQAHRFIEYFDVLILDEVDAFPYSNNLVLQNIISKCSKVFVYLSATMPKYLANNKNLQHYHLNKRYHGFDIPVPKCSVCFSFKRRLKKLLKRYKNKVVLVYFPTIKLQKEVFKLIKCDYVVNSKSNDRKELLNKIKSMDKGVIFTTTVLERGITIKDVQVIVYNAEHKLFNSDTLIQIAGRAGRKKDYYKGDVIFICKDKNKEIRKSIRKIKKCNA